MKDVQEELRKEAKNLLVNKKVDLILGYCMQDDSVIPCFISKPEDACKLVWNNRCSMNLAVYLNDEKVKVGIVAKGCDSRAVLELLKANQVSRDNLFILGVPCMGLVDSEGKEYNYCKQCLHRNPVIYDVLLGEKVEERRERAGSELEKLSREERFDYWRGQFNRCVGCMACRNVCPVCFCKECVLEGGDPEWVERAGDSSDKWIFHITRAVHLAGRCVECGACERACPVNIKLTGLYHKICGDVEDMFNYEAGMDLEDRLPLVDFNLESDEILEKNEKDKKREHR